MSAGAAIRPLVDWVASVHAEDLPAEVAEHTRWRVLDVLGLAIAGHGTAFGGAVRSAVAELHPAGPARVWGSGEATSVPGAAFANAAMAQALEFDDTHNLSVVHMSGPSVAAALATAHGRRTSGRELLAAVALGNEVSCRIGSVAPQQFHRRGFHPTGIFAPFGVAALSGWMGGGDGEQLHRGAAIVGSFAAGILQCWVDGTQTKFLHPGWAAQSGISAAAMARAGATGPAEVLEGRWGLFATHVQSDEVDLDLGALTSGLGERWESENSSFKPYPVAHVIHPYIDAILRLRREHGFGVDDVERVDCPIAPYQVGIVCEPVAEKVAPLSDSHGRVSLPFTLAEAIAVGRIDRRSYAAETLGDPRIRDLASRIHHHADATFPPSSRFKGEVTVTLRDGRRLTAVEEDNRGSARNPMRLDEIEDKFRDNVSDLLDPERCERVIDAVRRLDELDDATAIVDLVSPGPPA